MDIRYAQNGSVQIAYEAFGDVGRGEPLLLIMGLDFQMVWWPEQLIEMLVEAGFAVVRFDNRDTGLSTHFDQRSAPKPWHAFLGRTAPAYTGADMIKDALAVLDAVGWSSAHVLGGSMGAGIAQDLAIEHPARVRSLICCMGLPVDSGPVRTLRYIRPGVFLRLARISPGAGETARSDALVDIFRAIASPGYPFPQEWARKVARISDERAPRDPGTTQRHLAAGRAHRHGDLATITAPTLVVSGADDPLIRWQGGRDTAARIPGARLVTYAGMGHNIPEELFASIVDEVRTNSTRIR